MNFFIDRKARSDRCVSKDKLLFEILSLVKLSDPVTAHLILMPSLYGPEVEWFARQGVQKANMFCLESDARTRRLMREQEHSRDLWLTPQAQKASLGIDSVYAELEARGGVRIDFAYFDFFGAPAVEQAELFRKMSVLRVMKNNGLILVNHGRRFQRTHGKGINEILTKPGSTQPTQAYLENVFDVTLIVERSYESVSVVASSTYQLTLVRVRAKGARNVT